MKSQYCFRSPSKALSVPVTFDLYIIQCSYVICIIFFGSNTNVYRLFEVDFEELDPEHFFFHKHVVLDVTYYIVT